MGEFFLALDDVGVFVNDEKTRTFVSLVALENIPPLKTLTAAVDDSLKVRCDDYL